MQVWEMVDWRKQDLCPRHAVSMLPIKESRDAPREETRVLDSLESASKRSTDTRKLPVSVKIHRACSASHSGVWAVARPISLPLLVGASGALCSGN